MTTQNIQSMTAQTTLSSNDKAVTISKQLSKYIIYAGLGALGGATGVAFVIGFSIILVLLAPPPETFSPSITLLAGMAMVIGLSLAWLFHLVARRLRPAIFNEAGKYALSVSLTCSLITSLLQSFLFGQGL